MTISSAHRRDTFCWNYTKNDQYTVKSGYWVARNLLKAEDEKEVLEPSVTKLQAFAWTIKAPHKICHLIRQLITCHVAVTKNLIRRNIRCDNYCPRCGEPKEYATHEIFECPPALQVWPYQRCKRAQISFLSRVYMPIWITSSGQRVALSSQI